MSCSVVTNQQISLPVMDKVSPEAKMKYPKRVETSDFK